MKTPDARLLELLRELVHELHPQGLISERFGLDDSLERDWGLDSLARVEFAARIERAFKMRLPDEVFSEAETPRDLLRFLGAAAQTEPVLAAAPQAAPEMTIAAERAPFSVQTLTDAFDWHAARYPGRVYITLYREHGAPQAITYGKLRDEARAFATGLIARGVAPGGRVAIMLPTSQEFFVAFYGALYAGAVPVPLYPPTRPSQFEQHFRRIAGIVVNSGAKLFVTFGQAMAFAHLLRVHGSEVEHIVTVVEVTELNGSPPSHRARASEPALLQYTSGSTGQPKGVVLSHANLLANIHAMGEEIHASPADTFVSWLPLYHDMGLIGACLGSMYYAFPLVLMPPLSFLARPSRWLQRIQLHHGTITAAPNFAYELCLDKLSEHELEGLDLSSLRLAFNGAESVSPDTTERFCERFARHGFRREAMTPVYGLAECALGLAFPPLGRGPVINRIDRSIFQNTAVVRPARDNDPVPLRFVSCGRALAGHSIRIVDASGREVAECIQGRIQFQGPSATRGYFENPDETVKLIEDGWLNTGDLGYIANGELYVTGRVKDIIIRAGHNIHPQELEEAVAAVTGVRHGGVAVFAAADTHTATERLIVLAETRESRPEERSRMMTEINHLAVDLIGMPADEVVLVPPRTVLKTSSGKIRRSACRELYERGELGMTEKPTWMQLTQLALEGAMAQTRRAVRHFGELLWGMWACAMFGLITPPTWLFVALTRNQERARMWARLAARLLFRLCAAMPSVEGTAHVASAAHVIIVSNHASYLDGLLLTAALPPHMAFAVKQELAAQRIAGIFLRHLGSVFVERVDVTRVIQDRRKIEDQARAGVAPIVFAEGTLRREPGLLAFRMGAFVSAVSVGAPVIPVVIRGTRAMLPDGIWFPHPSKLEVVMCEPVLPDGTDWHAAIRLRDRVRQAIFGRLGEPDLAASRVGFQT